MGKINFINILFGFIIVSMLSFLCYKAEQKPNTITIRITKTFTIKDNKQIQKLLKENKKLKYQLKEDDIYQKSLENNYQKAIELIINGK